MAWVDNLSKAIALAKSIGMVGFKLSDGIASSPNRFGYYNPFEDADYTMKELFDTDSVDVISEGVTVGRTDTEKGTVCRMRFATPSHTNTPHVSCIAQVHPPPPNRGPTHYLTGRKACRSSVVAVKPPVTTTCTGQVQIGVRTGQDTVYSPWPQDKSETGGGVAILEHLAS